MGVVETAKKTKQNKTKENRCLKLGCTLDKTKFKLISCTKMFFLDFVACDTCILSGYSPQGYYIQKHFWITKKKC